MCKVLMHLPPSCFVLFMFLMGNCNLGDGIIRLVARMAPYV